MDSQIKILGHRVEIGEIEHAVREASGSEDVCVIAWPLTSEGAGGVVAFIAGYEQATDALIERCRDVLPEYMVPKEIHTPERLPLNANGKVDRKALRADLEAAQEKANR
jgi:acyl-coenzyme A synthetase/AMP-(fatty) acid ligase